MRIKLFIICYSLLIIAWGFSCEKTYYSPVPYAPVNLFLDLRGYEHALNAQLACISYYDAYPADRPHLAQDKNGYGGVLVIHGYGEDVVNLYAYDLSCPVEARVDVRIIPDDVGKARCPRCGEVYNISNGFGAPEKGSKFPLKTYRIYSLGNDKYQVRN